MPLFTQKDLFASAEKLMEWNPDPVPRLRLLRDVLRVDPAEAVYREAQNRLEASKWVTLLRDSQLPDGTWGRFHSQDSRVKQPFPTTESAIAIGLACGLEKDHPILAKAIEPILDYVEGRATWPDPAEKHDNPLAWDVWVRHFSAAVLASVDPTHPCLQEFRQIWAEAVKVSFGSGTYDRQAEIRILNQLLDCRMKDPVPFHRKYPLWILSATANHLPAELEDKVIDYLLHAPQGIYYVCAGPLSLLPPISQRYFWSWMQGHRLLSRFRSWKSACANAADWIWSQRNELGLWDLGGQISRKPFTSLPLSESWKRSENRVIDSSVEVLTLLSRCFTDDTM